MPTQLHLNSVMECPVVHFFRNAVGEISFHCARYHTLPTAKETISILQLH